MGVNSIKFEISQYKNSVYVEYTPNEFEIIKQRILGQQTLLTTIEGRLLMADFREEGMRLRIQRQDYIRLIFQGKPLLSLSLR